MRFVLNDKVIETGQTFDEVKLLMKDYGFKKNISEYSPEIIFHGNCQLETLQHSVVVHMYFDNETKEIRSIIIHPFPMNYNRIQTFLEEQFGKPDIISSEKDVAWMFEDGEVLHAIRDRFGDEEMIDLEFGVNR